MKKKALWLLYLLFPYVVLAESVSGYDMFGYIFMEAFVTVHMSLFVLSPLSKMFSESDSKRLFWILFTIRAIVLLFFDFFITPYIAIVDFFAVFIGAFIVVPISALVKRKSLINVNKSFVLQSEYVQDGVSMTCKNCGNALKMTDKFCFKCGAPVNNANVNVNNPARQGKVVTQNDFDSIFKLDEKEMVISFIKKEMIKAGLDLKSDLIPSAVLRRKSILNIIFTILLFVYASMIFFHFPIITYILGLAILILFRVITGKYDLMDFLVKEVKSRPSEKVSNIVMNIKGSLVSDNKKGIRLIVNCLGVFAALVLFINPRIIYEEVDGGYHMRYYAFGLTNFTSVEIPEEYKGKPVLGLRGNAFSNMFFLKKVKLPDTITEIRGQAFNNCFFLEEVNIPSKLESIGGASFYNCRKIKKVEFPDTVVEFGGEMFKNSSIEEVKLSEGITEIKGNSFENCINLKEISIPDKVTRIGGHAFYGNTNLSKVIFTENSKLSEIGSSAFRKCDNLKSIMIPDSVIVNERAFKESPTRVYHFGDNLGGTDNPDLMEYDINTYRFYYLDYVYKIYDDNYNTRVSITYISYNITPELKSYTFRVGGELHDEFTITSSEPTYEVTDDLIIKLNVDECNGEMASLTIYSKGENSSVTSG